MSKRRRIYLDNAATSWPKPEPVYSAADRYLRASGAPAGRSGYAEAVEVSRILTAARIAVARLIGADDARHVVFTHNGTDSLNRVIHGLLRSGDHAICTQADHNSVLRPLRHMEQHGQIEVTRVRCSSAGLIDADDVRRALRPNTRLVAMPHASNVTGVVQPVAAVGEVVGEHGQTRLLVDAAQSLGHWPVDVEQLSADFLAAPGHKGLLGPSGTGVLYIRPGREAELDSVIQGGTGTQSELDSQPDALPEKFESGSHNVAGLVGLHAALGWLESRGIEAIVEHEQQLTRQLRERLRALSGLRLYEATPAVGVVSVNIEGYDPQDVAAMLDASFGVQVRAGLHCAAAMHRALGTFELGGTVRLSLGPFNTTEDIDAAISAFSEIQKSGL